MMLGTLVPYTAEIKEYFLRSKVLFDLMLQGNSTATVVVEPASLVTKNLSTDNLEKKKSEASTDSQPKLLREEKHNMCRMYIFILTALSCHLLFETDRPI